MANVYMSYLGTNKYISCIYYDTANQTHECRFVQEATLLFNCKDWTENDRIIIFTTDDAYQKNWINSDKYNPETNANDSTPGLESCIQSLNLKPQVSQISIPKGVSQDEIWGIFRATYDQLNPGDTVTFDITHAFRTIPMLAIVVLNYAKIMKQIQLKGIFYGAFETLGSIQQAANIPVEQRKVPIIDYTALDQLLEWTTAIDNYIKTGHYEHIGSLTEKEARYLLSKSKGQDIQFRNFRNLGVHLQKFSEDLSTVQGLSISGDVQRIKRSITQCIGLDLNEPFKPVFQKIQSYMDAFIGEPSEASSSEGAPKEETASSELALTEYSIPNLIQAAQWCLDHNMIQQSITLIMETMISYFLDQIHVNPIDFKNRQTMEYRNLVNRVLNRFINGSQYNDDSHPDICKKLMVYFTQHEDLVKNYWDMIYIRNSINHAGHSQSPISAKNIKPTISNFLELLKNYI